MASDAAKQGRGVAESTTRASILSSVIQKPERQPMSNAARNLWPIVAIAIVVGAAVWWIFWAWFDTYHLATVRDGILFRDGVRTLHQFELAVRKTHVKTVVSLVDDREIGQLPFTQEMEYSRTHGIDVVRVPIVLGGWPSGDQIKEFLAIAQNPARQPVLVHCAQGVRRTGMMVAAYQRSVLKLDADKTREMMLTFGHSQRTVGDVQRFIENYDPQTESMTAELPASVE